MSRANVKKCKKALAYVSQLHHDGCVVACFAMLAGVSYETAFKFCFPNLHFDDPYPREMSMLELARALRKFGIKTIKTTKISKHRNKPFVISFDWKSGDGGHCVVWCPISKRFLDPGYPKTLRNDIYLRAWHFAIRTMTESEALVIV